MTHLVPCSEGDGKPTEGHYLCTTDPGGPVGIIRSVGYYKSEFLIDGEKWRRWHGLGINTEAFNKRLKAGFSIWTLSADANLGFGRGIAVNAGVGPTFGLGVPSFVRILGSLKVRGNAAIGEEGDGHAGWGINPEGGVTFLFFEFRWVLPPIAGGGNTEQGNSFFAGVNLCWPYI